MTVCANPTDRPALIAMTPAVSVDVPREKRPGLHARFLDRIVQWQEKARQRQALMCMAPHLMKDIGINEVDIWFETKKPLWRD